MSLYTLTKELSILHEALAASDGEISPDIEAALDRLRAEVPAKISQYRNWYAQLSLEADRCKEEAEKWTKRRKARERAMAWIKQCVQDHMQISGETQIGDAINPVRLVENSVAKLECTLLKQVGHASEEVDPSPLPNDIFMDIYDYIPAHWELNEDRLRAALAAGREIHGATLTKGKHVRL